MYNSLLLWISLLLFCWVTSCLRNYIFINMWNFNGTLHLAQFITSSKTCDVSILSSYWLCSWSICFRLPWPHIFCLWKLWLVQRTYSNRTSCSLCWSICSYDQPYQILRVILSLKLIIYPIAYLVTILRSHLEN